MMYMVMSFFRKPAAGPAPTTVTDGEGGVAPIVGSIPCTNLYDMTTRFVSSAI